MGHLITITLMTPAERDGENGVHRIGSRAWGLGSEASEKGMAPVYTESTQVSAGWGNRANVKPK